VVDPALDKPWPNNYGVWMDEAVRYGYEDCVDRVWKKVGIIFDEITPEQVLKRPYGRVDRKRMKARLISECNDASVVFGCARAVGLEHFDDRPSQVTIQALGDTRTVVQALLVVDATGFSKKFVKHNVKFDPGFQVTYGARFRVKDLGPYKLDQMVLMDFSEMHLHDDPEMVKSNNRFPSFLYAMPLEKDELFLEETILVSRPLGSSRDLQARLVKRMDALGIEATEILEDERAAIPMGGADPVIPQRVIGFGATSSFIHPVIWWQGQWN
jgi:lycopene cyclase-like protein